MRTLFVFSIKAHYWFGSCSFCLYALLYFFLLYIPGRYLGDQRGAYNQFLNFSLRIGEDGPQATLEDIVLVGSGLSVSLPIFGQGNPLPTTYIQNYRFRLHEHPAYGWNPRLTAHDFMNILSNLTAIKIKATYTPEGN